MTTAWPNQPDLTPRLSDVIRRWNLTRNLKHFEASANALVNHMLACSGAPEYWEEGAGSGRILTGPATLSVVTTLVTIGFSSEEAWNMTPGLSNWTIAVYSERNGDERRFFWESDLEEMPPDLTTVDEDTLYEQVIKDLGPKKAKEWRAARIRNKKQGTC